MTTPNLWQRAAANTPEPPSDTGCWLVRGYPDRDGYMRMSCRLTPRPATPRNVSVHRNTLEVLLGTPLPSGAEVDHRCGNPACWNPDHLEVTTRAGNMARRWGAAGGAWSLSAPAPDVLQLAADRAWDAPRRVVKRCPF